jgi:putative hydrolase of the HAD superfamily
MLDTHSIEAILFDMNGTLRVREADARTQSAAYARLKQLLGKPQAADAWWEELARRQKAYSRWAQEKMTQLSEAEIWTEWMLPEAPRGQIEPVAAELMLAWGERKGHAVPKPEAEETLRTLKERGYRLGLISNTMSTLDIPRSLEAFGWKDYFDTVVLSADIRIRKPAPEPLLEAAKRLGISPQCCAYLGNRLSKDMLGCKRAGYGIGLILEPPEGPRPDELEQAIKPDGIIHSLKELLDIFPPRSAVEQSLITR